MKISNAVTAGIIALGLFLRGTASIQAAELPGDANTTCPVMQKEEVDADLFVDYKGERVYLCCTKCKNRFAKDPDKYLARVKAAKAGQKSVPTAR